MRSTSTKKLITAAILLVCALVLGFFERYLPLPIPLPGARLGLSNVVILFALETIGFPAAFLLMLSKVLLSGLLFAGLSGVVYGLFGGVLSLFLMAAARSTKQFSFTSVSALGGSAHNAGQLIAAMLMLGSSTPLYYLPFLLVAGMLSGILTGLVSFFLLRTWRAAKI